MNITSVSYRALVSGPGFSNHAIEAQSEVSVHDEPELVLLDLKNWVDTQLRAWGESRRLMEDRDALREDVLALERTRDRLKSELSALETKVQDEIPF